MSSLTSQQINDSYQGLLKLADSTTGITSTLQSIQDGLGNDLPLKVKDSQIQGQNIFSFGYFVPDYEGLGIATTGSALGANSENKMLALPFYSPGLNSFSAITYRVITATTTSDTAEAAIYTAQFVPGRGISPKDLVMSGISITTSSVALHTTALPSTLSMSGLGSGIYFLLLKISNSGVTPTVRFSSVTPNGFMNMISSQMGYVADATGNNYLSAFNQSNTTSTSVVLQYVSITDFKTTYTDADFVDGTIGRTWGGMGFLLNVIK